MKHTAEASTASVAVLSQLSTPAYAGSIDMFGYGFDL